MKGLRHPATFTPGNYVVFAKTYLDSTPITTAVVDLGSVTSTAVTG